MISDFLCDRPWAPTENPIQNGEAQPEKTVASTAAENKGEHANTTAEQSHIEHSEAKVSAGDHVEDPVAETSAVAGTGESKDLAEVSAVVAVKPKPEEEPPIETQPANALIWRMHLEDAGVDSTGQPADEIYEAVPVVVVESVQMPDSNDVIHSTPGEEASLQNSVELVPDLLVEAESKSQCDTETSKEGSCERCPPEQSAEETIEAVGEVVVESSPEAPVVNNATPGEEAALQGPVETIVHAVSELPAQSAAKTMVESEEPGLQSAASAEPILKTRAEEVVECEVQPVNNAAVEQSAEPAHENAADRGMELNIEDALEPVPASEAGAVQEKLSGRAIELTDALDVEPPTTEAAPESVEDPKQSHSEESKLNQSDDTNT